MKEAERKNLASRIVNYCRKHKVLGSFNYKHGNYLVSFKIKDDAQDNGEIKK